MPELSLRRIAVFVVLLAAFDVWFDATVPHLWIDVPVAVAYGLYLEWLVGAFRLWPILGEARRAHRELRQSRRQQGGA